MNGTTVTLEETPGDAGMHAISIPLFDIDSTLLAGGNLVHRRAFLHALRTVYGIADPLALDRGTHGMIDSQIIVEMVARNGGTGEQARAGMDAALSAMSEYYAAHSDEADYTVLDGVFDLLQRLRDAGRPLGLLTGNVESIGWTKMERAGLKDFFAFGAFGSMAYTRAELVPMAQAKARETLGHDFTLDQFFIVGDSPRDVACAKAAGIPVVAVATGIYSAWQLQEAGADLVLDSLQQHEEFLRFMRRQSSGQLAASHPVA
jgi:phosphoglycolate phosphatase